MFAAGTSFADTIRQSGIEAARQDQGRGPTPSVTVASASRPQHPRKRLRSSKGIANDSNPSLTEDVMRRRHELNTERREPFSNRWITRSMDVGKLPEKSRAAEELRKKAEADEDDLELLDGWLDELTLGLSQLRAASAQADNTQQGGPYSELGLTRQGQQKTSARSASKGTASQQKHDLSPEL